MKTKVTVVGGGNVGATVAQGIALKELADVIVHTEPAASEAAGRVPPS